MLDNSSISEYLIIIYCIKTIDFIEKLSNTKNLGLYQFQTIQTLSNNLSQIIKSISHLKLTNSNLKKFIDDYVNNLKYNTNKNLEISIFDSNENISNDIDLETIIESKNNNENLENIHLNQQNDKLSQQSTTSKKILSKENATDEIISKSNSVKKNIIPYQIDKKLYVDKFSNKLEIKYKTKYGRNIKKINYKI